ncbi:MAG: motility protein A [SAR324 cluster bacterium]|uniref:Motility protein A n=1 Tax=SAR324 cluster bacterium TaxID=2024889 RepID=A0A2A4T4J9_9DELT|nr:MAG: motility protein A [SAR324 cluster bacterium]
MDIAAVLGTVGIIVVFLFGVVTPDIVLINLQYMWNAPSVIIVLFGTLAATLSSYPLDMFLGMGKSIKKVYGSKNVPLIETLVIIVDVAKVARKNVLAIEDSLPSIENEFLRNGLRLVVDRVDRELITDIMQAEIKYADKKKEADMMVIKQMSSLSPAFGMIGTLVGLVLMLQNLDDPSTIGPNMSVALITTLYGSLLSSGVFVPWSNALETARLNEMVLSEMVRDGILFIEKNERAEFIEQDLMNYLPPDLKKKYEELKFSGDKAS